MPVPDPKSFPDQAETQKVVPKFDISLFPDQPEKKKISLLGAFGERLKPKETLREGVSVASLPAIGETALNALDIIATYPSSVISAVRQGKSLTETIPILAQSIAGRKLGFAGDEFEDDPGARDPQKRKMTTTLEPLREKVRQGTITPEETKEFQKKLTSAFSEAVPATKEEKAEAANFAVVLGTDPLNFVGFGLGKKVLNLLQVGKVEQALGAIRDIGKVASKSNIDDVVRTLGKTQDESVLKTILTDIKEGKSPEQIVEKVAKENIDVGKLPDVTQGKIQELTERGVAIEQGLIEREATDVAARQLRQSPKGRKELKKSLKTKERIGRIGKQAEEVKGSRVILGPNEERITVFPSGRRVIRDKFGNIIEDIPARKPKKVVKAKEPKPRKEKVSKKAKVEKATPLETLTAKVKKGEATGKEIKQFVKESEPATVAKTEQALRKDFQAAKDGSKEQGDIAQGIDILTQQAGKKPKVPKPKAPKEPWEMTREEIIKRENKIHGDIKKVTPKGIRFTDNKFLPFKDKKGNQKITFLREHEGAIKQALSEGKPVPKSVLKDYPDLAKQAKATPLEQVTKPQQTFRQFIESKGVKWEQVSGKGKDEALHKQLFDEFNQGKETPLFSINQQRSLEQLIETGAANRFEDIIQKAPKKPTGFMKTKFEDGTQIPSYGSFDVGKAVEKIAQSKRPLDAELAKKLLKHDLSRFKGHIHEQININKEGDYIAGFFNRETNEIGISQKFFSDVKQLDKLSPNILHETLHGITSNALSLSPKHASKTVRTFQKDMNTLLSETKAKLAKELPHDISYPLSSPGEFVTGVLTNGEFQKVLSKIPYKNTSLTLWDKFVDNLRKLLNISKDDNLLIESVNRISKFIDEPTRVRAGVSGKEFPQKLVKSVKSDIAGKTPLEKLTKKKALPRAIDKSLEFTETPRLSQRPLAEPTKISAKVKGVTTWIRETLQDSQIRVKQLQQRPDVILKGKALDPYEAEIRMHGRMQSQLDDVENAVEKIDRNIVETSKNLKIPDTELNDTVSKYLIAKHAPEYNAQHGSKAAGITDAQAATMLDEIDNLPYANQVKRIGKDIQDLNKRTLDILKEGQVIDDVLYRTLRERYENYVPFNRIMDDLPNEQLGGVLAGGKGISVRGTGIKRAKGSEREIEDILAHSMANVQEAIVRAEKNQVGLTTLDFARNNPQLGLFQEVKPKAIGLSFKKDPVTGKPYPLTDADKLMRDKSVLVIREKGKPVYLKINDPALANAIRGTNREQLGLLGRSLNMITKWVTQTATRFNPAFQFPNIVRDTQELIPFIMANKNYGIKGVPGTINKVPKSVKDVFDAVFLNADTPGANLYRQMKADGGTTGGLALSTRDKVKLDIDKLRKINRSNPRKVAKEVTKLFDNYNAVFEDATRLSVYKSALQRGLTREEAAVLAKEATINFNRKGTIGAHFNALYAFANASVQGSVKTLRALKNPKVAATVGSSVFGATLTQTIVNDALDPDWRDKVPQWERNNNLVIVAPWKDKDGDFVRFLIPVSWGIKPIKTISDYVVDVAMGVDRGSAKDIALGVAGASLDAYNPVGGSNVRQAITPTAGDALFDIWFNQAWYGKPIKPENRFFPNAPEYTKYFNSLQESKYGRFLINTTEFMNDNVGISISPNSLKYAIDQIGGGTGRFATQTFNTALSIAKPKTGDINEIPVVNRFFKNTPKDVVEGWMERKILDDPKLKRLQEQSDEEGMTRNRRVRDMFKQYQESTNHEKSLILNDLSNQDPKAYESLQRRIKDAERGVDYIDSVLKDLSPEFRAKAIVVDLEKAKDKDARLQELTDAGVINEETAEILQDKYGINAVAAGRSRRRRRR